MHIPRTVYSHALHLLGFVLLCIGCIFYFQESEHALKDAFHFFPSILSFLAGIFVSIFNPEHFGWLSQVDPLTGLFMALTGIFAICGLALFGTGNEKAGELVMQTAAASFSFLGGLEAGMIRQRAKERAKRSSSSSKRKTTKTTEGDTA